ncbi:MAG TPA: L-aspartate oxidase [Bacteroidales bacterium]|nr:L-aspartate oxidase [Bacteroidales bacterium]HPS74343.1 L-aspartate oxidase [Bacteroidales bacterium]
MRKKVDFVVLGSGIAGLTFALKAANHGKVCIITKQKMDDSATSFAQGGIAAVTYNPDTYEKHIQDTLIAGDGLCDERIVRLIVTESTERIRELINWGVKFDRKTTGEFDLAKEGGHSEYRVLHYKDKTGREVEDTLLHEVLRHPNIEILEDHFVIDIITEHHLGIEVNRKTPEINCFGVYVLNPRTGLVDTILAKVTMIATGGAGQVYKTTTNPLISTGDGIAMVYRAKGVVEGMEFMQFHPTALYNPGENPAFLISEAVRGFGGVLKTLEGKEFMQKYDSRLSLAPRDIVSRAIDSEMKLTGDPHVYLDCRHLDKNELIRHFPTIYAKCLSEGINITRDMIPVVPTAHYTCGGIKVDENGHSSIRHLYASGECSSTGLHGANRLASNSLLEALVMSHRASVDAARLAGETTIREDIPDWNSEGMVLNEEMVLITQSLKEVQEIMTNYVGIVRSNLRLQRAFNRLNLLYKETEELYNRSILTRKLCELRNLINIGYLIIRQAEARKESRGLHYSIDYPRTTGR